MRMQLCTASLTLLHSPNPLQPPRLPSPTWLLNATHLCMSVTLTTPLVMPMLSTTCSKQKVSKLVRALHKSPAIVQRVLEPESGQDLVCSTQLEMLRCPSCWLRSRYASTHCLCYQRKLQLFCVLLVLAFHRHQDTSCNAGVPRQCDTQHYNSHPHYIVIYYRYIL